MIKTLLVIGFIGIVIGLLYMAWVKVLKPLHGLSRDGDLRKGLVNIVQIHLIPGILSGSKLYSLDSSVTIKENRSKIEKASDRVFDLVVGKLSSVDKERFYSDKSSSVASWVENCISGLRIDERFDEEALSFDDDLFNSVVDTYLDFSKYATNHPDALEWTAFGFMSWVNLNIDQVLEDLLSGRV